MIYLPRTDSILSSHPNEEKNVYSKKSITWSWKTNQTEKGRNKKIATNFNRKMENKQTKT